MSKKLKKTNACRTLDALSIRYETAAYAVDEKDLSAEAVADQVGLPRERVLKTLCVRADDGEVLLAVLSAGKELDFKALARAAGKKSVASVPLRELTELTGYVRGGVTALACKRPYAVYLDGAARDLDQVAVSAGMRGLQLLLSPLDYARATAARWAPLSRAASEGNPQEPRRRRDRGNSG